MQRASAYHNTTEFSKIFEQEFADKGKILNTTLTLKNLYLESCLLNEVESTIPENLQLDLHFDMIVNGGSAAVSRYHRGLLQGRNEILERAKNKLSSLDSTRIDEALVIFNEAISQIVREQDAAALDQDLFSKQLRDVITKAVNAPKTAQGAPTPAAPTTFSQTAQPTDSSFDAALTGGDYKPRTEAEPMGLVRSLFNQLTEGGSTIGILHLVLDIVGILGDFVFVGTGIPVGAIADVVNAAIYFVRASMEGNEEKEGQLIMLGAISLIAGLLFGYGDIMKMFKPVAKPMSEVMQATMKGGAGRGAQVLVNVPQAQRGLVTKGLRFIAANIGKVLGTASRVLGKFFDGFLSKLVGWIPLIGKPLKSIFDGVGSVFTKTADDLSGFSKGFKDVEAEAFKASIKSANSALTDIHKNGGKLVIDKQTGLVKVLDKSGNQIGEFSDEVILNTKVWNEGKAPGLFSPGKKESLLNYHNAIKGSNDKLAGGLRKSIFKGIKGTSRLVAFIGKQVIKLTAGVDAKEAGYSDEEVEYWGNAAITDWINQRISKEREESGATYLPAVNLDSSEKEVFDNITKYQNTYAKMMGQPQIIPVVYNKFNNDPVIEEFDDFWSQVASGQVKREETEETNKENEEKTNESISRFKYIVPFSRF